MATELPQDWLLEIEGKKTGPFTTEQVLGLFRDGEIPEQARITTESMLGRWTTVRDLAVTHQVPRGPAKPFNPPPRPQDLNQPPETDRLSLPPHESSEANEATTASDPAVDLFESLQAAKERKAHAGRAFPPAESRIKTTTPLFNLKHFKKIPARIWVGIGVALVLALALWGMVHFIRKKSPQSAALSIESARETFPPAHTAPQSQPVAPPPALSITRPVNRYTPPQSRPSPLPIERRDEHPEHDAPPQRDFVPEQPMVNNESPQDAANPPGAESTDIVQPNPNIQVDPMRHNTEADTNQTPPPQEP